MKDVTIRLKIIGCFGIVLMATIIMSSFAYSSLVAIERHALVVKNTAMPGLNRTSAIKDTLFADSGLILDLFIERDPVARRADEPPIQNLRAKMDRLTADYERTILTDTDNRAFANFQTAYADYKNSSNALVAKPLGEVDVATLKNRVSTEFDPRFNTVMAAIDAVSKENQERATNAASTVQSEVHKLLIGLAICVAIGLLNIVTSGIYLLRIITKPLAQLTAIMEVMRQGDFTQRMPSGRRDEFGDLADGFNRMADEVMGLVGQVQRSGIRVSTSMTEIAATSRQQQATASEVAATTTQIGATSREISATSRELVRTMNEVSTVAEHAAGLAGSGQTGLSHMEETMAQVMEAAGSINARLAVLNEKAGNINQVVTTITKVADQTNLLSLNAAIEAEKAGEYGRGFAVVSSEIRRLADQTAIATYDIEQMIKEIQTAVSAGVMGMDKFSEEVRRGMHDIREIGGKLSDIIAQVQVLVPRFETVNEGMQAQATGAEQISEALLQLTESTQQTVESLRQSSAAIDELNQVSGNLHGSISRFKLAAA